MIREENNCQEETSSARTIIRKFNCQGGQSSGRTIVREDYSQGRTIIREDNHKGGSFKHFFVFRILATDGTYHESPKYMDDERIHKELSKSILRHILFHNLKYY